MLKKNVIEPVNSHFLYIPLLPTAPMPKQPEWVIQGKSIKQLIKELESFEDQNLLVEISFDDGETSKPISLVGSKFELFTPFNLCLT